MQKEKIKLREISRSSWRSSAILTLLLVFPVFLILFFTTVKDTVTEAMVAKRIDRASVLADESALLAAPDGCYLICGPLTSETYTEIREQQCIYLKSVQKVRDTEHSSYKTYGPYYLFGQPVEIKNWEDNGLPWLDSGYYGVLQGDYGILLLDVRDHSCKNARYFHEQDMEKFLLEYPGRLKTSYIVLLVLLLFSIVTLTVIWLCFARLEEKGKRKAAKEQ